MWISVEFEEPSDIDWFLWQPYEYIKWIRRKAFLYGFMIYIFLASYSDVLCARDKKQIHPLIYLDAFPFSIYLVKCTFYVFLSKEAHKYSILQVSIAFPFSNNFWRTHSAFKPLYWFPLFFSKTASLWHSQDTITFQLTITDTFRRLPL